MGGTDNRAPNVIVTVLVSYLVGLPVACCLGVLVFGAAGQGNVGTALAVVLVSAALVLPGLVAYWWNYRRRRRPDSRPWV